jgi:hypothetical protein
LAWGHSRRELRSAALSAALPFLPQRSTRGQAALTLPEQAGAEPPSLDASRVTSFAKASTSYGGLCGTPTRTAVTSVTSQVFQSCCHPSVSPCSCCAEFRMTVSGRGTERVPHLPVPPSHNFFSLTTIGCAQDSLSDIRQNPIFTNVCRCFMFFQRFRLQPSGPPTMPSPVLSSSSICLDAWKRTHKKREKSLRPSGRTSPKKVQTGAEAAMAPSTKKGYFILM